MRDHIVALFQRAHSLRAASRSFPEAEIIPAEDFPPALYIAVGLSIALGLTLGLLIVTAAHSLDPVPLEQVVVLDEAEQQDYVIAAAEAFAADQDMHLVEDRLARLGENGGKSRVEVLALDYAPQHDRIAKGLAELAVALGSNDSTLAALNAESQATRIGALSAALGLPLVPPDSRQTPAAAARAQLGEPPPGELRLALKMSGSQEAPRPAPTESRQVAKVPESRPEPSQTPRQAQPTAEPQDVRADEAIGQLVLSRQTPTPLPTATPKPTRPKPTAAKVAAAAAAVPTVRPKSPIIARLPIAFPDSVGVAPSSIALTARPERCTPASEIGPLVDHTITLCAGQEYGPFRVQGENISIYGDKEGTSLVRGKPREFGISASGTNIAIVGVHVVAATDPADLNTWLCFYESCGNLGPDVHGGVVYGGGILLDGAIDSAVVNSTVSAGTIGIAVRNGANNKIFENNVSDLNGWGVFVYFSNNNQVIGNTARRINRPCQDPQGNYLVNGCESAAYAIIKADENTFFKNHCEHSGNCFYANGVGGYGSNNNRFFNNYCAAATANCYEVTYSHGNRFDYNVAAADSDSDEACIYPFWIGGSVVQFGSHNTWSCKFTPEFAEKESQKTPDSETRIEGF